MKAITYDRYGPPEVLQVREVPDPVAKGDQILVRVRAAEATKSDCELRAFRFPIKWFWLPLRLAIGVFRPRNRILGGYFAGEVMAVGQDAEGFAVGDEVYGAAGLGLGCYGELVALPAKASVVRKPSNMSFAEAAAVPLGGLNALHFLRLAELRAGESVLVLGAGGSIGLHGVQIAKALGAEVTGVDKAAKEDLVRRHGADHFIDYQREDLADRGVRYDVVFDMVPGAPLVDRLRVMADDGRYVTGNPSLPVMLRCLWTTWTSRRTASFAFAKETREELDALREMIEAGQIRSIVDEVLPQERAAEAHRRVEDESRLGALVIAVSRTDR